jgi:hypothetical protein
MNAAFSHLLWKEYRAIRAFWLSLVVLSLGLQFVAADFLKDPRLIVLNVALATPVFFALGCIGTAFALEKEEGTYDWLQASPASDAQVLWSKLALCVLGTATMFAVLWPASLWMLRGKLPDPIEWHGMLALWPLAAVEAIAWGALFSLRSERPLPAIILAIAATSTVVHLAAMPFANLDFSFERYLPAIPIRLLAIAPVLVYDVYLGLKWLQPEAVRRKQPRTSTRDKATRPATRPATPTLTSADTAAHLHVRDRGMLLGHLLWQFGWQSWRLMLLMVALQIASVYVVRYSGLDNSNQLTVFPLIGFAALMGACVFLPDQERWSFRFFVEHNVPPRKVWLTRLLPWIAVATISSLLVTYLWLGTTEFAEINQLLWAMFEGDWNIAAEIWQRYKHLSMSRVGDGGLQMFLGLSSAVLAFAAGQWISMFVRSGLLAGFFTLLAAMVMTLWIGACLIMQLGWLWFVLPIPIVLFFATWLRAPDWINENATWRARGWAAVTVAIPTALLCAAAPIVRVNQIPVDLRGPGFSVDGYLAQITPEMLANGAVYRRANEMLSGDDPMQALAMVLQAGGGPPAVLESPAKLTEWPLVQDDYLMLLVNQSGDQLTQRGELAEALERYLLAFKVYSDLTNYSPQLIWNSYPTSSYLATLRKLNQWGAHPKQSQEQLGAAIARLKQVSVADLHAPDAVRSNYILCERFITGDRQLSPSLLGIHQNFIFTRNLLDRLAPWEAKRELRALNLKTMNWLESIRLLEERLQQGLDRDVPYFANSAMERYSRGGYRPAAHEVLIPFDRWSFALVHRLEAFETLRRTSLIILACQAYQQKHGDLPQKLEDLVSAGYFAKLPTDPFTGRPFVYFREGLSKPSSTEDREDFDRYKNSDEKLNGHIQFDRPSLWSPGSRLLTQDDRSTSDNKHGFLFGSWHRNGVMRSPNYEAWARGEWFPIPLKYPAEEPEATPKNKTKAEESPDGGSSAAATDVGDLFREPPTESRDTKP